MVSGVKGINERIKKLVLQYQQLPETSECEKSDSRRILSFVKQKDVTLSRKKDTLLSGGIRTALEEIMSQQQCNDPESELDNMRQEQIKNIGASNAMNLSLQGMYQSQTNRNSFLPSADTETMKNDDAEDKGESPVEKAQLKDSGIKKRKNTPVNPVDKSGSKKMRVSTSSAEFLSTPSAKLSDMGGIDECIEQVLELIGMPLKHPEIYIHLGISPPRGILLHGPAGCGKTMLGNAIADQVGVPFFSISAPSIVSGMSGESEKKIRQVFEQAQESAPCLLFIDEIDAITPKRETAQREMERRIVAQLLTCMDDCSFEKTGNRPILIIGATNRPDSLDPALRRAGRFDREISMGVPDENARMRILQKMSENLRLSGDFDFKTLAKMSPGYVGADLKALTSEAGMIAVKRIFKQIQLSSTSTQSSMDVDDAFQAPPQAKLDVISEFLSSQNGSLPQEQLDNLFVTNQDFLEALKIVQPSSKREGFATVPDVTWQDIGALSGVRDELRMAVVEPIKRPELFQSVGIDKSCGVLLYGPPGCGKTLLAKAVSNESTCNFISVKGPELLNKYVGESERAIRQVFARARSSSPCVIFFDELDALCPNRSSDSESQSSSRLVNTLLTEMDGMHGRKQVYVIAATNRPDMIDPAMLRPGRLDKALYVDFPTAPERRDILNTITRKTPLAGDVDLQLVAGDEKCNGFSGADLASLVREAGVCALKRVVYAPESRDGDECVVSLQDFLAALERVVPSVGLKDRKRYEKLKSQFG